MPTPTPLTERERVERFEAAYNRIDRALTELIERRGGGGGEGRGGGRRHTFAAKVRIAANRLRRLGKHVDFLQEIGDLRNALVHSRTDVDVYIAVPSQQTVEELERIEQKLFAPEKVIPRFARKVVTLRPDQTLAEAWAYVRQDGYSRYPVYGPQGFVGLLTSNGFARWIANQAKDGRLEVDARQVKVTDVLAADHRREFVVFVAADASLDDVTAIFADNRQLEAVIITEHGRSHEKPLGLLCAADVAGLE
jgi:CBS domain-containing protein